MTGPPMLPWEQLWLAEKHMARRLTAACGVDLGTNGIIKTFGGTENGDRVMSETILFES